MHKLHAGHQNTPRESQSSQAARMTNLPAADVLACLGGSWRDASKDMCRQRCWQPSCRDRTTHCGEMMLKPAEKPLC